MSVPSVLFFGFVLVALFAATAIMFSKNLFKATLLLLICLLAVAAIYIFASAEFIAVTQILIYAGGVIVVLLFGIMLTQKKSDKPMAVSNGNNFVGVLSGSVLFFILARLFINESHHLKKISGPVQANAQDIGQSLISDFALPFEIVGVILLVALIGAAVMASSKDTRKA